MSGIQTAEDFMRENAHLIAQQDAADARRYASPLQQQAKKNKRQEVDAESLRIEKEATDEIGLTNWAGRLLEYRMVHPPREGLKYFEQAIDHLVAPRFTTKVVIEETPLEFGSDVSFSNKKSAKQYASKKAIDWLIEHKHMPPGGAVKWPKVAQSPSERAVAPLTPQSPTPFVPVAASYASKVPDLCTKLGFPPPRYEFVPIAPNAPIYNCWADFGDHPEIDGRVGECRGVHGKKTAKEMVAKEVLSFLKSIETQRMAGLDDDGEKARKRKRTADLHSSSQGGVGI